MRNWIACALLALSWNAALAQTDDLIRQIQGSTPLERAEAQAEVLTDVLGLTPRQTEAVIQVNLKYSTKIQELMDQGADDSVLFANIKEFAAHKDEEIKALLTKSQIRRYEAHKARMRKIVEDVIQYRNR